jgi:hypothetical protein
MANASTTATYNPNHSKCLRKLLSFDLLDLRATIGRTITPDINERKIGAKSAITKRARGGCNWDASLDKLEIKEGRYNKSDT